MRGPASDSQMRVFGDLLVTRGNGTVIHTVRPRTQLSPHLQSHVGIGVRFRGHGPDAKIAPALTQWVETLRGSEYEAWESLLATGRPGSRHHSARTALTLSAEEQSDVSHDRRRETWPLRRKQNTHRGFDVRCCVASYPRRRVCGGRTSLVLLALGSGFGFAEVPALAQGDTAASPNPDPSAKRTSDSAAAANAPPRIAGHATPDVEASMGILFSS